MSRFKEWSYYFSKMDYVLRRDYRTKNNALKPLDTFRLFRLLDWVDRDPQHVSEHDEVSSMVSARARSMVTVDIFQFSTVHYVIPCYYFFDGSVSKGYYFIRLDLSDKYSRGLGQVIFFFRILKRPVEF